MANRATASDARTAPWRTHTVANQPPPLTGLDVFSSNLPLVEATEREGAGWIRERASALGPLRRRGGRPAGGVGAARERAQAGPAHPRPLRQPDRRGRVPPRLAQADDDGRRARAALAALDERRPGRARRAHGDVHDRDAGRGRVRVPDHDDLRRRPRAARPARARGGVGAARDRHDLRPPLDPRRREGLGDRGHGDDREAGRLGRAREHDLRAPAERRRRRAPSTSSPATSGSARRRCPTSSSCSPRPSPPTAPPRACRAF